jgi:hypothetical protein
MSASNCGVNERRARGLFLAMVSMMNILPEPKPLISDVRHSGSGPGDERGRRDRGPNAA